jgi:hypothetical protein
MRLGAQHLDGKQSSAQQQPCVSLTFLTMCGQQPMVMAYRIMDGTVCAATHIASCAATYIAQRAAAHVHTWMEQLTVP